MIRTGPSSKGPACDTAISRCDLLESSRETGFCGGKHDRDITAASRIAFCSDLACMQDRYLGQAAANRLEAGICPFADVRESGGHSSVCFLSDVTHERKGTAAQV